MADKNLSDDMVKLVEYTIISIDRGNEEVIYPKNGEPGRVVPADNIRQIVELDGSLWGLSGSRYVGDGQLVLLSPDGHGRWTSKQVGSFESFPQVVIKLDEERALAATSRSIERRAVSRFHNTNPIPQRVENPAMIA